MVKEKTLAFQRILSLETLRFFALVEIILSHFEFLEKSQVGYYYKMFFHNSVWGVNYFFLLSGFGLYLSLHNKEISSSPWNSLLFAANKIKKIYFPYIFSLLIYFPFYVFFCGASLPVQTCKLLINFTMLQSLSGISTISMGINGVCWFVSTLFICYIFSPLMINLIRRYVDTKSKTIALLGANILMILVVSKVFLVVQAKYPIFNDLFYGSPYVRMFYVILGMLLANIFILMGKKQKSNTTLYEVGFLTVWIFYFFFRNILFQEIICLDILEQRFLDILIAMGSFVFIFNGSLAQFLSKRKWFVMLGGKLGMYLFLLHYPVRLMVDSIFKWLNLGDGIVVGLVEIVLILCLTFPICLFIRHINEKVV